MLTTLTLIIPDLNPALAGHGVDTPKWPTLARLAGRGTVAPRVIDTRLDSLHAAILDALDLRNVADQYPSAAVTRTGLTNERAAGFWLRMQPMHFIAGLDRITTVVLRGAARMTVEERSSLAPMFAEHLQSTGIELHAAGDEWLLRSESPLRLQTVSPEFAAANPHSDILPRGADAGPVRRLMTEMQMLLHEHPVNVRRQARGAQAINAVWVHGEGMLSDLTPVSLPAGYGEDPFLRGIYRLHDQTVGTTPADAKVLLAQLRGPTVAVIDPPNLDALETQWLAPLARALLSGAFSKLTLMMNEWRVSADRADMFKLWRRERPPMEWVAC
ncbi:MAG: hypothetical protein ABW171_06155 [Steroidobacter sp.]